MTDKNLYAALKSDITAANKYYIENRSDLAIQQLQIVNSKILLEILNEIKSISVAISKAPGK